MNMEKLRKELWAEKSDVAELAKASKTDYDAGRYEGLKLALEIVDKYLDREHDLGY